MTRSILSYLVWTRRNSIVYSFTGVVHCSFMRRTPVKQCTQCRQTKPPEDFMKNSKTSSGLGSLCKECNYSRVKEWKNRNKEKFSSYRRDYMKKRRSEREPEQVIRRAVERAQSRKVAFERSAFEQFVKSPPIECVCCGIKLDYSGKQRMSSPSADKVIPKHGYVKGNVQIICTRCNCAKGDSTIEQLIHASPSYKFLMEYIKAFGIKDL